MRNVKHYIAVLISLMLLTGCSEESTVSQSDTADMSETADQITTGASAPTEASEPTETFSSESDTAEIGAQEALTMSQLYERYHPGIGETLDFYTRMDTASGIYDVLQQVDDSYYAYAETLEGTYQEVYSDCQKTAPSNFLSKSLERPASEYDPVSALFYQHRADMEVNPIALISEIIDHVDISFLRDTSERYGMQDWYDITCSYPITTVSTADSAVTQEAFLLEMLHDWTGIPTEQLQIGYSETEQVYYCYFVDLDNQDFSRKYPNLLLGAMYFQFDDASGKLSRCGAETYIRVTDSLKNTVFYAYYGSNAHAGYRSYYETDADDDFDYSADSLMSAEIIYETAESVLIPDTHKAYCSFVLSLLTNGDQNAQYEAENRASFELKNDFHSAMNECYHFTAGHFVTWFTLS